MLDCISGVTNWLIKNNAIKEKDRELYEYAIHSLWLLIAPILLAFVFGAVMGTAGKGLLVIFLFVFVRKFSGGYHAKSESNCLIGSSILIALCVYCAKHMHYTWGFGVVTAISVISLSVFSPIDSANRRLKEEEKMLYRKLTERIAGIFLILHVILVSVGVETYAVCIGVGLIMSASLQIPCILKKILKIE